MSTTMRETSSAVHDVADSRAMRGMPFLAQVGMLARRAIVVNLRVPAAFLPSLAISLFTLFVYKAQFGGVAGSFLPGQSYLGFILPLSVLSAALSGAAVAGQTIVGDIGRGYFDKLGLTPASRWALLLGPMLAGGAFLALQSGALVLVGLALGLKSATGLGGLLTVVGLSLLIGVGFSGLMVGVALLTGNAAATAGASFLFFPLTFLTSTFVPLDRLDGWIGVAARINPVTYPLEAMRATLNTGWDADLLLRGVASGSAMFALLFAFALYGLRARTRRR